MTQLETSGGKQRPYEPLNRVLVIYQRVGSCQYSATTARVAVLLEDRDQ